VSDGRAAVGTGAGGSEHASLWRDADFLKLWGAETLSQVGAQVSVVAVPLTAIVTLDATPAQVGLLAAAQYAAVLVVPLFAGVWLDTHRRRPALVAANAGRAVILGMVPLLYAVGALSMPALYAIAFLAGVLTAFFDVGYVVYLPSLVHRERLVEANAKLEATYSTAEIVGPGLGGVLVQVLAAPVAVAVDALSYLAGAASIASIDRPEPVPAPTGDRRPVLAEVRSGFTATLGDRVLRPLVVQSAWFNVFEQVVMTFYLVYGVRTLHLSPGVLGAVLATGSLGALAGTLLAPHAGRRFGVGRAVVGSMALSCAALVLVPVASGSAVTAVATLVAGLVVYGLGLAVFNVYSLSIRAQVIPPEVFGRATATYQFVSHGAIPVGGLLGAFLGATIGVRPAMFVAVAALAAGAARFTCTSVRSLDAADLAAVR
jgi:MFS family permease